MTETVISAKRRVSSLLAAVRSPHGSVSGINYFKGRGYKRDLSLPIPLARANAFDELLSASGAYVYDDDLIAGSLRGIMLDVGDGGDVTKEEFDYYCRYPGIYGEKGFPHQADHYAPAYDILLARGVGGILEDIAASKERYAGDKKRLIFLESCRVEMEAFARLIRRYAEAAEEKGNTALRDVLLSVESEPPRSFVSALQLVWLAHVVFCMQGLYAMALGRFDQYLYPFYKADIDAGIIDDDTATEYIASAFIKIGERRAFFGGDDVVNICIGGRTPDGENGVTGLTLCTLHAVGICNIPGPNLSARISRDDPADFLPECLKVIGTGLGYPALMNDETNVKSMARLGYPIEDARRFCMVGCIENLIQGRQEPWNDGRFDTPKYLEYTINRGVDILKGEKNGIDVGDFAAGDFPTMDSFMRALERELRDGVGDYAVRVMNEEKRYNPENYVNPFMSCLTYDCVGRGLDICDGGALYPGNHGAATMGIGTMADSLAAIEKCVYTDKTVSPKRLIEALKADFVGYEDVRRLLLDAPKYGNNDDTADKYAVWYVDFLAGEFDRYRTPNGGRFVTLCAANTSNIWAGMNTAATPDGRRAKEPLSDAGSPTYGRDKNGVTQTVLSLVKPDYTLVSGGSVVNQKFTPDVFREENLPALAALIKVYFAKGGQEMQINSVSRETLKDAMKSPEKYEDLVVRVSGFSAYFTRLDPGVQKDILERTEHPGI
ncbi:MAG: hypothetical protein IJT56_07745 [Clostridia bacterium]|nr:hypothetical protein [Clostridia bacterium]